MSLLEGSWEEYADSMDQELERLKESEKALKEKLEKVSREKDAELRVQAEKIKELEALLASKQ